MTQEFKSNAESDITMAVLMHPEDTNVSGNIFGGKILALMDQAAYACACKHAHAPTVTASVNTVNFLTPIYVGDLVKIKARVNYVGRSSMVIGLRVEAENIIEGHIRHSNSSYFTMIAIDDEGKSKPVAGLLLQTKDDVRRYVRSIERLSDQKARAKKYNDKSFQITDEVIQLCHTHNATVSEKLYPL